MMEIVSDNEELGWQNFMNLCRQACQSNNLTEVFEFIFSPEERHTFAMRVQLVHDLLVGKKTQRDIAKTLQVSIAKVTRGSNALKMITPELRDFLTTTLSQSEPESLDYSLGDFQKE